MPRSRLQYIFDLIHGKNSVLPEMKKVQKAAKAVVSTTKEVAKYGTIAFAGIAAAVTGVVAAAAKFEDIGVQFEVLTGSVESANDALTQLKKFSAGTPFQFEGIAKAGKQLLGFGFAVKDLTPLLSNLGDVAAASGKPIEEISLIFGQVSAAGKLTGERLLQFQERAIPIGPAIAKTMGIAETSVKDMVTAGKVDFKTFQKAFQSMSKKGGFAFEGLGKLSKTLSGKISTLKDNFILLAAKIGDKFLPVSKVIVDNLIKLAQSISKNIGFFNKLKLGLAGVIDFMPSLVIHIDNAIKGFRVLTVVIESLGAAVVSGLTAPLLLAEKAINGVVSVLPGIVIHVDNAIKGFRVLGEVLKLVGALTANALLKPFVLVEESINSLIDSVPLLSKRLGKVSLGITDSFSTTEESIEKSMGNIDAIVNENTAIGDLAKDIKAAGKVSFGVAELFDASGKQIRATGEQVTAILDGETMLGRLAKGVAIVGAPLSAGLRASISEGVTAGVVDGAKASVGKLTEEPIKIPTTLEVLMTEGAEGEGFDAMIAKQVKFLFSRDEANAKSGIDERKRIKTHFDTLEKLNEGHKGKIVAINKSRAKALKAINKQIAADRKSTFATIATLSNSNNSTLASIGKAAGITQIAISTPVAVGKALAAFPPPFNFIAAGLVGTAMAAQAAQIAGVKLAGGLTEVPSGFANDTFAASLTSGERVVNVEQNKDLTEFLDQERVGSSQTIELLASAVALLNTLVTQDQTTVIEIDSQEIITATRAGLRAGGSLAV